jgi:hypothetical protein
MHNVASLASAEFIYNIILIAAAVIRTKKVDIKRPENWTTPVIIIITMIQSQRLELRSRIVYLKQKE